VLFRSLVIGDDHQGPKSICAYVIDEYTL